MPFGIRILIANFATSIAMLAGGAHAKELVLSVGELFSVSLEVPQQCVALDYPTSTFDQHAKCNYVAKDGGTRGVSIGSFFIPYDDFVQGFEVPPPKDLFVRERRRFLRDIVREVEEAALNQPPGEGQERLRAGTSYSFPTQEYYALGQCVRYDFDFSAKLQGKVWRLDSTGIRCMDYYYPEADMIVMILIEYQNSHHNLDHRAPGYDDEAYSIIESLSFKSHMDRIIP